jgi:hypothetical protein
VESSCSHSAASKGHDVDDFEEVAQIIQNTFNTSAKYNKYKVNTHDFLMNQLSEIMNQHQEEAEACTDIEESKGSSNSHQDNSKGIVTQSIIQKRARDS